MSAAVTIPVVVAKPVSTSYRKPSVEVATISYEPDALPKRTCPWVGAVVVPVPPRVVASAPFHPGVKVWVEPDEVIAKVMFASVPVANVCVEVERPFNEVSPAVPLAMMLVVLMTPFTFDVRMFVDVAKLILFVVEEATMPASDVVEVTPFTLETRFAPDVVSVLFPITLLVAETPLIVVVRTLPVND